MGYGNVSNVAPPCGHNSEPRTLIAERCKILARNPLDKQMVTYPNEYRMLLIEGLKPSSELMQYRLRMTRLDGEDGRLRKRSGQQRPFERPLNGQRHEVKPLEYQIGHQRRPLDPKRPIEQHRPVEQRGHLDRLGQTTRQQKPFESQIESHQKPVKRHINPSEIQENPAKRRCNGISSLEIPRPRNGAPICRLQQTQPKKSLQIAPQKLEDPNILYDRPGRPADIRNFSVSTSEYLLKGCRPGDYWCEWLRKDSRKSKKPRIPAENIYARLYRRIDFATSLLLDTMRLDIGLVI
ncbi:uncharacterized protein LOC143918222 [Arctopsyche grandis]|uniref:uncharacterized protein LOC143918222 n=1 Tax=Arctopsyche grandis TaxID=121162 RepID=UPI00406D759D